MYLLINLVKKEAEYGFTMYQIEKGLKFVGMGDHDTRNDFLLWVELIMVLGNKAFTVLK
jgi:hypothetical protein